MLMGNSYHKYVIFFNGVQKFYKGIYAEGTFLFHHALLTMLPGILIS